jgi:glycosyltransferase involved in cell wall biosynthesis
MKILMVNKFHYRFGGAETYYFALSELLRQAGHTVIPFAMKHPLNEPSKYSEFFVDSIDFGPAGSFTENLRSGVSSVYSFQARKKIGQVLDRVKPDVVHIHNFNFQLTPSILYAIKSRHVPVVHTMHDPQLVCPHHRLYDYNTSSVCEKCTGLRFRHAVTTRCIKGSYAKSLVGAVESYLYHTLGIYQKTIDLFISPSEFLRQKTFSMGFAPQAIRVIPNFVDSVSMREGQSWGDYCVYAGRLSAEKGLKTLVKAMQLVTSGRLIIAGDGPLRNEIEAEISRAGISNIALVGHKSPDQVCALLQGSAFAVIASEWYENNPLSVLESFACGKAVVASASGGVIEMVEHEKTGLLFPPGNSGALVECMNRLFASLELQRQLGSAARRIAEQRYAKKTHLDRITAAYEEVTRGKN